jgi:hypothetical protein
MSDSKLLKETERRKLYYQQHKERIKQYNIEWAKRNPERKREQRRLYKRRHPDRVKEQYKKYSMELQRKVFIHYGGNPPKCNCCGETKYEFLTVDHIYGGGNKERKKIFGYNHVAGYMFYLWLIKNNYPEGYQVLCYNCNLGKTRNNGVCPHKGLNRRVLYYNI